MPEETPLPSSTPATPAAAASPAPPPATRATRSELPKREWMTLGILVGVAVVVALVAGYAILAHDTVEVTTARGPMMQVKQATPPAARP